MRIIAGKLKAKKINGPKTEKTRPTLDRVKEALFSILSPYIKDANVLDLFSGTGNLGIESISRGAKFAWLNDKEISTIISNIKLTKLENCVKITRKDYTKCLIQIQNENLCFDIIFLDPPYESQMAIHTLEYISNSKVGEILSKDGVIVYETDKNFMQKKNIDILDDFENLQCFDKRSYGNVILMLYKWR
ncbi:MAG: 16S rRNA (guanine(966)-N(2))-methyltransferase RsmD [Clostridia bacterium]|nr:16S rRNA (guanine(966)-N(2))-methyltransferase RsmD [Clostridia bacterium]